MQTTPNRRLQGRNLPRLCQLQGALDHVVPVVAGDERWYLAALHDFVDKPPPPKLSQRLRYALHTHVVDFFDRLRKGEPVGKERARAAAAARKASASVDVGEAGRLAMKKMTLKKALQKTGRFGGPKRALTDGIAAASDSIRNLRETAAKEAEAASLAKSAAKKGKKGRRKPVDLSGPDPLRARRGVARVLERHRPQLHKVFAHFAASDPHREAMDIREFLYMMQGLALVDYHNLDLREAAKVYVAVTSFVGDPAADKMDFDDFNEAVAWCCEVKTYDGIVPLEQRLDNFLVNEFFQKLRAKTNLAAAWLG